MSVLKVLSHEALRMIKARTPFKSGNLRDHGVKLVYTSKFSHEITIGGATAPYAVYTNEKWVSPKWNGKHNPNEHWIDNAVEDVVQRIVAITGGRLASSDGTKERLANKSFWESDEGQALRTKYNLPKFKF